MNDASEHEQPATPVRCRRLGAWVPVDDSERPAEGPGSRAWAANAASRLAARPANPDQVDVVRVLPTEFHEHSERLRQFPDAERMFNDNWAVALVTDLRRLVSAQPTVRVGDPPRAEDLGDVAQLTLPLERTATQVPDATFDPELQSWKILSKSPNMRVTNRFHGETRDGAPTFGFVVEVLTSFMSVAEYRGRLILRDGYHRAHRLISAGVFSAPVFVRAYADDEPVFNGRMLPEQIWSGPRPPLVGDFSDDAVSHDVWLPETRTSLYIAAIPPSLSLDPRAKRDLKPPAG